MNLIPDYTERLAQIQQIKSDIKLGGLAVLRLTHVEDQQCEYAAGLTMKAEKGYNPRDSNSFADYVCATAVLAAVLSIGMFLGAMFFTNNNQKQSTGITITAVAIFLGTRVWKFKKLNEAYEETALNTKVNYYFHKQDGGDLQSFFDNAISLNPDNRSNH